MALISKKISTMITVNPNLKPKKDIFKGSETLNSLYRLCSKAVMSSVLTASGAVRPPESASGPAVAIPIIMLGIPETMTMEAEEGKPNNAVIGLA